MTDFTTSAPPPHSIQIEQGLIGTILSHGADVLDRIEGEIKTADFYNHPLRLTYEAMQRIHGIGRPVDVGTVAHELEVSGALGTVGGFAYLAELADQGHAFRAAAPRWAAIIREYAQRRHLQQIGADLLSDSNSPEGKSPEAIAHAAISEIEATVDRSNTEPTPIQQDGMEVMQDVDRRRAAGALAGLSTGFTAFDAMTGGLEPGQLVILAARPSVGKSVAACNIAAHVAAAGKPALFLTLEMTKREIAARILAALSGVTVQAMRAGTNDAQHWAAMSAGVETFARWPLFLDDRAAVTVAYVRAKARRLQRSRGLELVVIDYLQLMTGKGDNRAQEVGSISRGLKALAKELRVPIIALAQLNRGTENRTDRRPTLSDLRDSGEIEQDADIVAMLHRESMYRDAPEWAGLAELLIRKNRNGPTGECVLELDGPLMQFRDYNGPSPRSTTADAPARRRGFDDCPPPPEQHHDHHPNDIRPRRTARPGAQGRRGRQPRRGASQPGARVRRP